MAFAAAWAAVAALTAAVSFCRSSPACMRSFSSFRSCISFFLSSSMAVGMPPTFSCALASNSQSSPMNIRAFLPCKKPVRFICIFFGSGLFSDSKRLKIKSLSTSSSIPMSSVVRFVIHGLITSRFTLLMSTFFSRLGAKCIDFMRRFSWLKNRLSCSEFVPRKKPASAIFELLCYPGNDSRVRGLVVQTS